MKKKKNILTALVPSAYLPEMVFTFYKLIQENSFFTGLL
jgi:hypothetical protein